MSTASDDNFGAPEPGSIGYNTRDPAYYPADMPAPDSNEALYWSPIDDHYRAVMLEDTDAIDTAAAAWRAYAERYSAAASAVRALGQNLSAEWTSPEAKNRFLREVGMLTASLDEWAARGSANAAALAELAPTVKGLKTQMRALYYEYIAEARRLQAEDDTAANDTDNPLELLRDLGDWLFGSRISTNTENYSKRSRTEILDPLATAYDRATSALNVGSHYQGRTDAQIPPVVAAFGGTPPGAPQVGAPGVPNVTAPALPAAPTIPSPSAPTPPVVPAPLAPPRPLIAPLPQFAPPVPGTPLIGPAAPRLPSLPHGVPGIPVAPRNVGTPPSVAGAPPAAAGAPLALRGRAGTAPTPPAVSPAAAPKPQAPNLGATNTPTQLGGAGAMPQPSAPTGARPPANLTGRNAPPTTTRTPPPNPALGGRTTNRARSPIGADPQRPVTPAPPANLPGRSGVIDRRTPKPITVPTEVPPSLRGPKPRAARVKPAYDVLGQLAGRAGGAPAKATESSAVRPSLAGLAKLRPTPAAVSGKRPTPRERKPDHGTPLVGGTELFEVTPTPDGPGMEKKRANGRIARAE